MNEKKPLFVINSTAPIRICDNGGWTDTWFARHGSIFNIGVYPYAEVQVHVYHAADRENQVVINAENYGERYAVLPEKHWDRHPLLEAAIETMHLPADLAYEVSIYSAAPAGASTGTSSSISVALIGALDWLTPGRMTAHEVAYAAHKIETDVLQLQCGIQDQLCAAYGGINFIEMVQYPNALVSPIVVPDAIWWELERRLALVYLGKAHRSSEIHELVIKGLKSAGPECKQLEDLRHTASCSRDALYAGDFDALGAAMIENTAAQERLHPRLVSPEARQVIEIARAHGAIGWKVNGAGGDGGSVTILSGPSSRARRAMLREIEQENPLFKNIPIYLSRYGLRVWKNS